MTVQDLVARPPDGFWSDAPTGGTVWDRGRSYSHAEVRQRGDALVTAAGLPPRSLAFLFVDSSVNSISAYLGFLRAGHVVCLADHRLPAASKNALVQRYGPGAVWSAGEAWIPAGGFARADGAAAAVFVAQVRTLPVVHPDLALLLSTSGTTGSPKLVRLSYTAIQSNAEAICHALAIDDRECAVTSLTMSSAYGLSVVNSHLCAGASLVCTNDGVKDPAFWGLVSAHDCTSFAGVPFHYDLLRDIDYWADPQPSIRTYTQAGGAMSAAARRFHLERAESSGARLVVMYGQTEATARISVVPPGRLAGQLGTIGEPLAGGHLSLVDPDPVSGEGELLYQGPNVMMGYAEGLGCLSLGDVCGGRLRTGDIAARDASGSFRIVGRSRRIVKPFGLRISLDHLEQVIADDMAQQAAVVGDDSRISVFVLRGSVAQGDLAFRLGAITRLPQTAFRVIPIDDYPVTPSGKLDYARLRVIADQDTDEGQAMLSGKRTVEATQLCDAWSRLLGVSSVMPDANVFLDLGADSITAVSFLAEVESAYGVRWTLAELIRNPTIHGQALAIAEQLAPDVNDSPPVSRFLQLSSTPSNDILFFASSMGHEWAYMHLAKALPESRGFHVLRDWRLDAGKFVPQSVAELARHYTELLLRQPETPPVLGGWCLGGLLAFEVAVRLEAAGRPPRGLVLIDAIIRRPSVGWLRDRVVGIAWRNARGANRLSAVPGLRALVSPNDVGWRLLISLLNVDADYDQLPIGPMADFVLGKDHGIDPALSVAEGFAQLYEAAHPRVDPLMRERFLFPGVNAQTALLYLLVLIGNRLSNKKLPSGRTRIPTLFITPSQAPQHRAWRRYAVGALETVVVHDVESFTRDFDAHANMLQPRAVSSYAPQLLEWLARSAPASGSRTS